MCENCKYYKEETDFVGKCDKIRMMILLTHPNPEVKEQLNWTEFNVRKEFKCNQFEDGK